MKKKNFGSDEENEFEVDEPEEIQNDASEDDWTPEVDNSRGRRSTRLRNIPKSRAPIIDASSSDEEGSDNSGGPKRKAGKGRGRGRQPAKKHKVSSSSPVVTPVKNKSDDNENENEDEDEDEEEEDDEDLDNSNENSDSEPSSTTANNSNVKVNKDFTSGAFVILKTDADNEDVDPPLWKIDGKALLQKYIPFEQDGKTLYKNTSVYSGWTITNKDNYYPVSVTFKQQTRKEHIVEFRRDQIKKDQPEEKEQEPENHSGEEKE